MRTHDYMCALTLTLVRRATERGVMAEYGKALGARLRKVRQRAGMSLQAVEQKSDGHWKGVVVGSYERGDRAVSVQKLAELAQFYGVAVRDLLPPDELSTPEAVPLVLNLERLRDLPAEDARPVLEFAATVQQLRGVQDTLLPIREADLHELAKRYDLSPWDFTERLVGWGVLPPGARITAE